MTNTASETHRQYLLEAIAQAVQGVQAGRGSPFGAVLVHNGELLLAATSNEVIARCDPTAHAEILAVRSAAATLGTRRLDQCVAYTSCEPCPMCLAALAFAGVREVYYAATAEEAAAVGMAPPASVRAMTPASPAAVLPIIRLPLPERLRPFDAWTAHRRQAAPAPAAGRP